MHKHNRILLSIIVLLSLGLGSCSGLLNDTLDKAQAKVDAAREEALRQAQDEACAKIPEGMPLPKECGPAGTVKHTPQTRAVVLTASDAAGSLSLVGFAAHTVTDDPVPAGAVGSDAVGTFQLGTLFVLNRDLGNISVIDPSNMSVVQQYKVGTNPQAFAAKGTQTAYVTDYESNEIMVLDPFTGKISDTIDLSEYADNDGTAEVSGAQIVGDRLFVAVQRLDRTAFWSPTANSGLVVIDTRTNTVEKEIILKATNPVDLRWDANRQRLLVAETGSSGVVDGGIEIINAKTLESEGFLLKGSDVGGDVSTYAVDATGNVIFIGNDASWNTMVQQYDASSGTVITAATSKGWKFYCGVGNDRGEFWVCDRSDAEPGVRIFSVATGEELTDTPITTALPPKNAIVFLP